MITTQCRWSVYKGAQSWELQDAFLPQSVTSGLAAVSHVVSVSTNTTHSSPAPNTGILSHRVSVITKHHQQFISALKTHRKVCGGFLWYFPPTEKSRAASRDRANPGPEPRPEPEPVRHETLTRPPSRHCDSPLPREYGEMGPETKLKTYKYQIL